MEKQIKYNDLSAALKIVVGLSWFWGILQSIIAVYYMFAFLGA